MRPSLFLVLPLVATLAVALCFGEAARESMDDVDVFRWLAAAPRGSLATPTLGPAVYRGELLGPPGRVSTSGTPVTANWWAVVSEDDEQQKVHCLERHRDELALRADGRTVPLDFFGTNVDDVALSSDDRWDEGGHAVIDLGPLEPSVSRALPARAVACAVEGATVHERSIPVGSEVEVVACYKDGILGPCIGPLRGLVVVGTEREHRGRRARAVRDRFRVAEGLAVAAMIGITILLAVRGAAPPAIPAREEPS